MELTPGVCPVCGEDMTLYEEVYPNKGQKHYRCENCSKTKDGVAPMEPGKGGYPAPPQKFEKTEG